MAYKGRIQTRSPYFVTANVVDNNVMISATLQLKVWVGLSNSVPGTVTAALTKNALTQTDENITFEISEFINDELIILGLESQTVNVQTVLEWEQTGNVQAPITNTYYAFNGYTEFEDKENYQGILDENTTMYVHDCKPVELNVFADNTNVEEINFNNKGLLVHQIDLTTPQPPSGASPSNSLNSSAKVFNASFAQDPVAAYIDKAEGQAAIYEENKCWIHSVTQTKTDYEIDEVTLHSLGDLVQTIKVVNVTEAKYTPKKVEFINKLGLKQITYLFKVTKDSLNLKRSESIGSITSIINDLNRYVTTSHSTKSKVTTSQDTFICNSGFVNEDQNEVFKQMLLSNYVWVDDLPVIVMTNKFEFKTRQNDGKINYTVSFKYAHQAINNIR